MHAMSQTPEDLLTLIFASDEETRLEICRTAICASEKARRCFSENHEAKIDNLNRHIRVLSGALLAATRGESVDQVVLLAAKGACEEQVTAV